MPVEKRPDCVTAEELVDYFDHRLEAGRERRLEEHLAVCEDCSGMAREVYALSMKWDQWTARAHADACATEARSLRALLDQALSRITKMNVVLSQKQLERWAAGAEGAVKVIIGEAANISRIVTEGLEMLLRPSAGWRFAPVEVSPRGIGPSSSGGPGRVTQVETSELSPSRMRALVAMDAAAGKITVSVENYPANRNYPDVLLVPMSEGAEPELGKWKSVYDPGSKTVNLYAEFSRRKPGEYFIAFEPLDEEESS
jgi:anti-sigma factor RsiW